MALLVDGAIMLTSGIASGIFVWRKRNAVRTPPLLVRFENYLSLLNYLIKFMRLNLNSRGSRISQRG